MVNMGTEKPTRRILLVDDEGEVFFQLYKDIIGSAGVRDLAFDTAKNGKEARDLFEKNQYDVVVSDLEMPQMNGLDFLRAIQPQLNSTYFVLVSGRSDLFPGLKEEVRALGGRDALEKPIEVVRNLGQICQEKYSQDN